jgi:hypothetical protein
VDADNDTVTITTSSDLTLAVSIAISQGRKVPLLHLVSTSPSNPLSVPSAPTNPVPTITPIVTLGASVATAGLNAASE